MISDAALVETADLDGTKVPTEPVQEPELIWWKRAFIAVSPTGGVSGQ